MFKSISKIVKVLSAISVIALLAGQVLSAPLKTGAEAPRFNFRDGDKELFTGLNQTAGETVYTDPLVSNGSDQIVGMLYYHNGVVDTTAANTTLNVTLPPKTDSLAKVLTGTITASNADPQTISDTIVNGQIVGQSGLTINVPTADANVSFIKDSVRWFPNKSETPVALPAGIDGNDLITAQGLNIGDVQGCWQYSGYIAFGLKVTTPVHPVALAIEKTVRNETLNQAYSDANDARPGDVLGYNIVVKNSGESNADKVTLRDYLPSQVTLLPGTINLFVHGSTSASAFPDSNGAELINSPISIGDLPMGDAMTSRITFSVKVDETGLANGQVLTNKAEAAYQSLKVSDQAKTTIAVTAPLFQLSKSAFNETQKLDATTALANPGDTIRYHLTAKNIGTAAGSYTVKDGIADVLEYSTIGELHGGTIVNQPNAVNDDEKIAITFPEVQNIVPGDSATAEFTVIVKKPLPTNPKSGNHYDLTMYNAFGNAVVIHITPPVVVNPALTLVKDVRDVTTGELAFSDQNTVTAGDTLEYRLVITNTSTVSADGVKIIDTLPTNVVYIPGTTVLTANGSAVTLVDGIASYGIILPQIPANTVYTIYLRAKIDSGVAGGVYLVNLATVTSGNINISDQAKSLVQPPIVLASAPVVTTRLPVTGASGVMGSIFGSLFILTNLVYFGGKKKILTAALLAHS